jgi:hypothetical protein
MQRGYIALTSVIILIAILLAFCATLSAHGFFARTTILRFEYKIKSEEIMRSCVSSVLQKLADTATYKGDETVDLHGFACTISQSAGGDPRPFTLTTTYHHSYTRWQIRISLANLDVLDRIEVP